jgi:hypothetical protein
MGTMFLRSIDASEAGVRHTGEYIYGHIRQAILDVGAANVVQVVTDNASNCVSMGHMLERDFPTIVWTPCASHCLDLLIEDIAKLPWVHALVSIARRIVTFVTCKHKALSIYRKYSKLEILKPAKTRFSYLFIVLARLVEVKPELRRMIVSPEWMEWEGSREPKAKVIESYIFNPSFWHDVESLVGAIKPIVTVLRLMDREGSTMGLLYEMMDRLGESLRTCTCLSAERYIF